MDCTVVILLLLILLKCYHKKIKVMPCVYMMLGFERVVGRMRVETAAREQRQKQQLEMVQRRREEMERERK